METYDQLVQRLYTEYQRDVTIKNGTFNVYQNCFENIHDYEDAISEVFISFHNDSQRREKYIQGILTDVIIKKEFRVSIKRKAIDRYRRVKRKEGREKLEEFSYYSERSEEKENTSKQVISVPSPEETLIELEQFHNFFKESGCSERETLLFIEHCYNKVKQKDLAQEYGISERTIRQEIKSAIEKLKKLPFINSLCK